MVNFMRHSGQKRRVPVLGNESNGHELYFDSEHAPHIVSCKNGASAMSLQQELGLGSYLTAWTWLHKLRQVTIVRLDNDYQFD